MTYNKRIVDLIGVIGWIYGKDQYFRGLYDMFGHKLDVRLVSLEFRHSPTPFPFE